MNSSQFSFRPCLDEALEAVDPLWKVIDHIVFPTAFKLFETLKWNIYMVTRKEPNSFWSRPGKSMRFDRYWDIRERSSAVTGLPFLGYRRFHRR